MLGNASRFPSYTQRVSTRVPVACRGDAYLICSIVSAFKFSRNSKYALPKLGSCLVFRHVIDAVYLRGGLVYARLRHFIRHHNVLKDQPQQFVVAEPRVIGRAYQNV